jgi:hypothetical protein
MLAMLPEGGPEDHAALTGLQKLMGHLKPNANAIGTKAREVGHMLQQWEQRIGRQSVDENMLHGLLARLRRKDLWMMPVSWDLAKQLAWAANVLAQARVASRSRQALVSEEEQTLTAVQELLAELAFPPNRQSPVAFSWDERFEKRLGEVLKRLMWEKP